MRLLVKLVFTISSVLCNSDDGMRDHKTIYEFTVKDSWGQDTSLGKYRGNMVIIVNVASQCGFTDSHYRELKELQDKYYKDGLRVAAFPCNQFGSQEPGSQSEISQFVKEKYNYEPDLYAKVLVNGEDADPFWKWLKEEQGGTLTNAIKWNFTKFLVNKRGHVVSRYAPTTSPAKLEREIQKLLAESY